MSEPIGMSQGSTGEWTCKRCREFFMQMDTKYGVRQALAHLLEHLGHQAASSRSSSARPVEPTHHMAGCQLDSHHEGVCGTPLKECLQQASEPAAVSAYDAVKILDPKGFEPAAQECHHHRVTKECHECAQSPVGAPSEVRSSSEESPALSQLELIVYDSFPPCPAHIANALLHDLKSLILAQEKAHQQQVERKDELLRNKIELIEQLQRERDAARQALRELIAVVIREGVFLPDGARELVGNACDKAEKDGL